jgi:hypothetical protein
LNKVVVVLLNGNQELTFNGEELHIIENPNGRLIVKDLQVTKAVFNSGVWSYWKYI